MTRQFLEHTSYINSDIKLSEKRLVAVNGQSCKFILIIVPYPDAFAQQTSSQLVLCAGGQIFTLLNVQHFESSDSVWEGVGCCVLIPIPHFKKG